MGIITDSGSGKLGRTTPIPSSTDAFTRSGWFRCNLDAAGAAYQSTIYLRVAGLDVGVFLTRAAGTLAVWRGFGATYAAESSVGDVWVYLAIRRSAGGTMSVVSGKEGGSLTERVAWSRNGSPEYWTFQTSSGADIGYLVSAACLRDWSDELSIAQLETEMASETPVKTDTLVANYRLADTTNIATDGSGNGNDLTSVTGTFNSTDDPFTSEGISLELLSVGHTLYAPTVTADATLDLSALSVTHALYAPTLSTSQNVALPLLSVAHSLYSPALKQSIALDLLSVGHAIYSPIVASAGTVTLPLLSLGYSLYAPSLVADGLIDLGRLDATHALYAPTLTSGSSVALPLLNSTHTLYTPVLTHAAQTISMGIIGANYTMYAPTIAHAAQTVSLGLLSVTHTLYAPELTQGGSVALPRLDATYSLYAPVLTHATQTVELALLSSSLALYAPALTADGAIELPRLDITHSLYAPTLAHESQSVVLDLLSVTHALYAPTLTHAAQSIALGLLSATHALYAPSLAHASSSVALPRIDVTHALYAPGVTNVPQTVDLGLLSVTHSLYAPTLEEVLQDVSLELISNSYAIYSLTLSKQEVELPLFISIWTGYRFDVSNPAVPLLQVRPKLSVTTPAKRGRIRMPVNIDRWDVPPEHRHLGAQLNILKKAIVEGLPGQMETFIDEANPPEVIKIDAGFEGQFDDFDPGFTLGYQHVFIFVTGSTTTATLTGIKPGKGGQQLWLVNASGYDWTLQVESVSSAAGYRFAYSGGLNVPDNSARGLVYISGRWRSLIENVDPSMGNDVTGTASNANVVALTTPDTTRWTWSNLSSSGFRVIRAIGTTLVTTLLGSDDVVNDSTVDSGAGTVSDALEYIESSCGVHVDSVSKTGTATVLDTDWSTSGRVASANQILSLQVYNYTNSTTITVSGVPAGEEGQLMYIRAKSTSSSRKIVFSPEHTSSVATSRFRMAHSLDLTTGLYRGRWFVYRDSRWDLAGAEMTRVFAATIPAYASLDTTTEVLTAGVVSGGATANVAAFFEHDITVTGLVSGFPVEVSPSESMALPVTGSSSPEWYLSINGRCSTDNTLTVSGLVIGSTDNTNTLDIHVVQTLRVN